MDSLKNIPDQPLTFNIDKNFGVELTSDNGKYKVMGENPDNFPKEPAADDTTSFTMTASALVRFFLKTAILVSTDLGPGTGRKVQRKRLATLQLASWLLFKNQ